MAGAALHLLYGENKRARMMCSNVAVILGALCTRHIRKGQRACSQQRLMEVRTLSLHAY